MSLATLGLLLFFGLSALFASVIVFSGAPYLPTLRPQIKAGLDMLDLQPGQQMLEIGCGDGRVLLAAAARGWQVTGYEINPLLAVVCWWRTRKVRPQVRVVWGNAWTKQWPPADGIYMFGLPRIMPKLHTKITQNASQDIKVASFSFQIPDQPLVRQQDGVFLYHYRDAKSQAS